MTVEQSKAKIKINQKIKFQLLIILIIASSCELKISTSGYNTKTETIYECGPRSNESYNYNQTSNEINIIPIDYETINSTIDPLAYYQWHLDNRGQRFVNEFWLSGNSDINVKEVHNNGLDSIRGRGVNIAVVDSGLELYHEDLRTLPEYSIDLDYSGQSDTTPPPIKNRTTICDDHGTAVGGIIAAKSGNGVGGVGVAPSANLIGVMRLNESQSDADLVEGFQGIAYGVPESGKFDGPTNADIFNLSFGLIVYYPRPKDKLLESIFNQGVIQGRNNKGYLYFHAAGNSYYSINSNNNNSSFACTLPKKLDISCADSNFDFELSLESILAISAINEDGTLTFYSTTGSNVFLNAPAGGFSYQPIDPDNNNCDSLNYEKLCTPAILTTDLMGCARGYSREKFLNEVKNSYSYNYFQYFYQLDASNNNIVNSFSNQLNTECNYTSTFNGTSSATPIVSGVAALLLEKHPNLTWRQVKYILAKTAYKNHANETGRYFTYDFGSTSDRYRYIKASSNDSGAYMIEYPWITNAAGFNFSNRYGFGTINANPAINFDIANDLPSHLSDSNNNTPLEKIEKIFISNNTFDNVIPIYSVNNLLFNDLNNTGTDIASINVDLEETKYIENVELIIEGVFEDVGELIIRLTSPSGTKSTLMHPFNAWSQYEYLNNVSLYSNAFYQEAANGRWLLEVLSVEDYNQDYVSDAKLNIFY